MFQLSPNPKFQQFDDNGNPLTGGKVQTFIAGTSTPVNTYTDSTGSTANTNPVILDARGEADIWISDNVVYKFVLLDANDVEIWSVDNISAPSGSGGGGGGGGELVKVSATDLAAQYLNEKLAAGPGVSLSVLNPGGVEQVQISASSTLQDVTDNGATTTQNITVGSTLTLAGGGALGSIALNSTQTNISNINNSGLTIDNLSSSGGASSVLLSTTGSLQAGSPAQNLVDIYLDPNVDKGTDYTGLKGVAVDTGDSNRLVEYDIPTPTPNTDELIKISANDTTSGYLATKLQAGSNISLNTLFGGGDERLEIDATATTAGILETFFFTGDSVTLTAGTFYEAQGGTKGSTSLVTQVVSNNDNQKQFYAQDLISIEVTGNPRKLPPGKYEGRLTAQINSNSADQRFTMEIYQTDANGTPEASGVTGQPVGDLGVQVVAILDSGIVDNVANNPADILLTGFLPEEYTVGVGKRLRIHVSAEKVGSAGGVINFTASYGSSANSFIEVPAAMVANSVEYDNTTSGLSATNVQSAIDETVADLNAIFPGGSNTQVQFNDSGAFGGDSGLTYDKATGNLTVGGSLNLDTNQILMNRAGASHGRVGSIFPTFFDVTANGTGIDLRLESVNADVLLYSSGKIELFAGTSANVNSALNVTGDTTCTGSITANIPTGTQVGLVGYDATGKLIQGTGGGSQDLDSVLTQGNTTGDNAIQFEDFTSRVSADFKTPAKVFNYNNEALILGTQARVYGQNTTGMNRLFMFISNDLGSTLEVRHDENRDVFTFRPGGSNGADLEIGVEGTANILFIPSGTASNVRTIIKAGTLEVEDGVFKLGSTTNTSPTNGDIWNDGTSINIEEDLAVNGDVTAGGTLEAENLEITTSPSNFFRPENDTTDKAHVFYKRGDGSQTGDKATIYSFSEGDGANGITAFGFKNGNNNPIVTFGADRNTTFGGDVTASGQILINDTSNPTFQIGENDTTNNAGLKIFAFDSNGALYYDHKTETNGTIFYRCGEGTESPSARTFMEVDPSNADVTFGGDVTCNIPTGTQVGLVGYDANGKLIQGTGGGGGVTPGAWTNVTLASNISVRSGYRPLRYRSDGIDGVQVEGTCKYNTGFNLAPGFTVVLFTFASGSRPNNDFNVKAQVGYNGATTEINAWAHIDASTGQVTLKNSDAIAISELYDISFNFRFSLT